MLRSRFYFFQIHKILFQCADDFRRVSTFGYLHGHVYGWIRDDEQIFRIRFPVPAPEPQRPKEGSRGNRQSYW